MKKFQIPEYECKKCSKNIYILTIIPFNEMNIAINMKIGQNFGTIFKRRGLKNISPCYGIFQVPTSAICKRYNRYLNELFANVHPNLVAFIAEIKNNVEYYSNMMRFIRSGSMELPKKMNFQKKPFQ
ncbi:hypothetical protein MXB_1557 [Myxobolus squamalis]|nr:hypothetical protein MXB_1557 [Myxobolus squamalis]